MFPSGISCALHIKRRTCPGIPRVVDFTGPLAQLAALPAHNRVDGVRVPAGPLIFTTQIGGIKMASITGTTRVEEYCFDADDERIVLVTDPGHRLFKSTVFTPVSQLEPMIESIADPSIGMLQAVILRRGDGGVFFVEAGRKRVLAAREAKIRYPDRKIKIRAVVRTGNDAKAAAFAAIENCQRIQDNEIQKGEHAASLLDTGYSHEEIEAIMGDKWSRIQKWIRVSGAPMFVRDAFRDGEISLAVASRAARAAEKSHDAADFVIQASKIPKEKKPNNKFKIQAAVNNDGKWDVSISGDLQDNMIGGFRRAILSFLDTM